MRAWLELARITNLPSALTNVLMAYYLAHGSWVEWLPLMLLLVASATLYTSGMILNDWADANRDRQRRPDRPIPAGKVTQAQALRAVIGLQVVGLFAAIGSGCFPLVSSEWSFHPLPALTCLILISAIWAYDVWFKQCGFAPWLMGACRGWNVLLGAATVPTDVADANGWLFPHVVWIVAAAVAAYAAGVTWLARSESETDEARSGNVWIEQSIGLVSFVCAFILLFGVFFWSTPVAGEVTGTPRNNYLILLAVIAFVVLRRVVGAIVRSEPAATFLAIVTSLRSMMTIDAALVWGAAHGNAGPPLVILGLLFVSLFAGHWSKPT